MKRKAEDINESNKLGKIEFAFKDVDISPLKIDFKDIKYKEQLEPIFRKIAETILNKWVIVVDGKHKYRLVEIEFYLNHPLHPDSFTHGDTMQAEMAKWYFHKAGSTYKSGSYKGLDISFGQGDKSHGGILIRSIQNIEDGSIIEGPCNSVNELLKAAKKIDIPDLVKSDSFHLEIITKGIMYVQQCDFKPQVILSSIRVGLSLKKPDSNREYFIHAPYRYMTNANKISKEKSLIALEMLYLKQSVSKVSSEIKMKIDKATEIKKFLDSVEPVDIKKYIGKTLKIEDYASLIKLRGTLPK